jgi:putative tryptophan/tyrosine transport system substrate-binding protein
MKRRKFLGVMSGAAWPLSARAQQSSSPTRKIGLLMSTQESDPQGGRQFKIFRSALERLGWVDSRNLSLIVRWSGGEPALAKQFAKELVRLAPDLIVASSTIGLDAARSATSKIPILFVAVSDPVAAGYIDSLARPGGNITGFSSFDIETGGKWLEILKEAVPSVARVGVLMNPDYAGYMARWRAMEKLGPSFSANLSIVAVRVGTDIENAISEFAKEPNGGLIVFSSALTTANSTSIIDTAKRNRLPTIYPFAFFAKQGGLISYGIDTVDLFQRSASYADRILRGTGPSDLPVQEPIKFELVINLKTAKALGIIVPPTLLSRADEVIE